MHYLLVITTYAWIAGPPLGAVTDSYTGATTYTPGLDQRVATGTNIIPFADADACHTAAVRMTDTDHDARCTPTQ